MCFVFQVDERVAPDGDANRNLTHLRESLLQNAPVRPEQIYAMPVELPNLDAGAGLYGLTFSSAYGTRMQRFLLGAFFKTVPLCLRTAPPRHNEHN